ncbi:interferon a3-like [Osmerus eperlanus]|uniref:interferon a3-like n=1 Tax=Osmerus eperlanus TaxID=29151 RepID=UPI002E10B708
MKCLLVCLCSQSLSLKCRWLDQKFKETNAICLGLLHIMGGDFTEEMRNIPAFPEGLYTQTSNAAGDDKAWFMLQVLEEILELFNEDLDSVTWEEIRLEHFLSVLDTQKEGLKSCIVTKKKKSKKLQMYFKRLENHILKEMGYSAKAWELIRKVVRRHLNRLDVI